MSIPKFENSHEYNAWLIGKHDQATRLNGIPIRIRAGWYMVSVQNKVWDIERTDFGWIAYSVVSNKFNYLKPFNTKKEIVTALLNGDRVDYDEIDAKKSPFYVYI